MEGCSKSSSYFDFMGVGPENPSVVMENPTINRENGWPIKRELTPMEVQNDVFYIEKEAFWAYILPKIPHNHGEKLAARGDLQIMVKDERCVFYIANLSLYQGFYVMSSFRNQGHTFVRSRGLGPGQKIWLRWANGYMEVKVFE